MPEGEHDGPDDAVMTIRVEDGQVVMAFTAPVGTRMAFDPASARELARRLIERAKQIDGQ